MDIPRDWTFEPASVAAGFDRHVREQLPWYELATGAVAHIARHYIPVDGVVYDLGASTGNVGLAIKETLEARRAKLIPVEASAEMCSLYAGPQPENLMNTDVCAVDFEPYDVVIMFLVLMFVPVSRRPALLSHLRQALRPGGVIITFDKTEREAGYIGTILHRLTLAGKVAAGTNSDDIIAKELSLSGVQRPINRNEMTNAIPCFQFGEFTGWIEEAKL